MPIVFVIDIDGCLVGDITPQLILYEMAAELKKHNIKIPINMKEFHDKLKSGIVRPHFIDFYKQMKRDIPDVEFFIYTASQKKWAEYLVKNIEKSLNISFNRPLFTRDNCILMNKECKKSLRIIKPFIIKTLKKKHGYIESLDNKILMIDNTNVFHDYDQKSLLLCRTYKYHNLDNIPIIIKENIYNTNKSILNNILKKYINIPYEPHNYQDFEKLFYSYYVSQITDENNNELSDKFWYMLTRIITEKTIRYFSPKAVEYLNRKLKS